MQSVVLISKCLFSKKEIPAHRVFCLLKYKRLLLQISSANTHTKHLRQCYSIDVVQAEMQCAIVQMNWLSVVAMVS